jgi:hypothetical protein
MIIMINIFDEIITKARHTQFNKVLYNSELLMILNEKAKVILNIHLCYLK